MQTVKGEAPLILRTIDIFNIQFYRFRAPVDTLYHYSLDFRRAILIKGTTAANRVYKIAKITRTLYNE